MIRRLVVTATAVGVLALAAAAPPPAAARGPSSDSLIKAGWDCFFANNFLHCVHDFGDIMDGEVVTSTVLAFDASGEFLGTELLIRADHYHMQPCPQDKVGGESGLYVDLRPTLDYFVCHHFDSPAT